VTDKGEKQIATFVEQVQPHCDETVRSAMLVTPAGSMGAMGLSAVSPLGGMIAGKQAKKRSGGLSKMMLLAVTDSSIIAFDAKPRGTKWKVKGELRRWDRSTTQIGAEKKKTTHLLVMTDEAGESSELELQSAGGGHAIPVFFESLGLSAS